MSNDVTVFAETTYRNQQRKFGIKVDDRRRHMYLIGKTGMGKSTIQENMIVEDIRAGHGVAVVDPHGDLAEKIMHFIPKNRINDVVYFNPADQDFPVAFNIVEHVDPNVRHLVASGLVGVFQKLWAESWGPRLEYILRNAILAVLDYPGSTLLSVVRMLSDKKFRKKVVDNIQNPVIKAFWVTEFAGYNDKFASEAVAPIQNKVGQFLSTTLIRNIVGQKTSALDMRKIMDEGKILVLNLSKGRIGEDNSKLLGAMMITKLSLAAMSRVDIPENERKDFFLFVDEFQNFATDAFAGILSEARKYRLSLILAHQYIEQLPDTVRSAVFGNVGTIVTFRVGAADAEALAPEFFPTFLAEDIVNLPKYEVYLKLMIDGVASDPFSARGLMPLTDGEKTGNLEKIIQVSRERYASDRETVEQEIADWHEDGASDTTIDVNGKKKKEKPDHIYKYKANCNKCGVETKLPFEPDGVRPIFCTDCLSNLKNDKNTDIESRKKAKEEEVKNIKTTPKQSQSPVEKPFKTPVTNQAKTVGVNNTKPSFVKKEVTKPKNTKIAQPFANKFADIKLSKPVKTKQENKPENKDNTVALVREIKTEQKEEAKNDEKTVFQKHTIVQSKPQVKDAKKLEPILKPTQINKRVERAKAKPIENKQFAKPKIIQNNTVENKSVERRKAQQHKPFQKTQDGLSLSDVIKTGPVNFSGKKLAPKPNNIQKNNKVISSAKEDIQNKPVIKTDKDNIKNQQPKKDANVFAIPSQRIQNKEQVTNIKQNAKVDMKKPKNPVSQNIAEFDLDEDEEINF